LFEDNSILPRRRKIPPLDTITPRQPVPAEEFDSDPVGEAGGEAAPVELAAPDQDALDMPELPAAPEAIAPVIMPRPKRRSEELLDLYDRESAPVEDHNGRLKSALLNSFYQMGQNAQDQVRSGRVMDEYALASILGGGAGGAFAGAVRPELDEARKRQARMTDVGNQVKQALAVEEQERRRQQDAVTEHYREGVLTNQAAGIEARKKPKPFIIGGRRINYKKNDADEWEPVEETVDGKPLVDASKVADADGLLPSQKLRAQLTREQIEARQKIATQNNQFKREENQANRDARAAEGDKNRAERRAALSERIAARLEADKDRKARLEMEGKRVRISYAKAKIEADKEGTDIDTYIDALSDNNVEVYK
jgi:hypothetical protein